MNNTRKISISNFAENLDRFRVPLASNEREKRKGNIPYYGAAKIIDYVNDFTHQGLSVLIAEDGSVETEKGFPVVQLANGKYWVNNHTHVLKGKDDYETKYLYYALQIIKVSPFVTGAVQKKISQKALNSIEISYFEDKNIRHKIVDILSSLDEKIQLNTQINQTLEQIAQAIFKSWFVDFDPVRAKADALAQGKTQAEAELAAQQIISGKTPEELTALSQTHPDRYAELAEIARAFPSEFEEVDGFGEVPRGWQVKRIDDVIQKIPVGKKYSSKTALEKGNIPILDQGRSGIIGYHNNEAGVKASIEEPVIVFANHTCYMRLISYDFSAIQNVFAFKGKELNIYWTYLATLGKQEFVEYKGHFPDFLIKEIIVPNPKLTELFGNIVKEIFSKIFINDLENSYLSEIRDLLLPKLLS
ncbi:MULTISPECIES: restriction endonuclease subunit S [unclassified Pasteurella]|uniref:restriction endonuclease subunit S n=1 Tax=unclassified Pasteurella TaxID=2621516 RepID=UPI001073BBE0|nr:restriction endonuclease subunit S [Pasteurella sp. 19428wF3_WM03]TFU52509.1 restriction endonuclease subunit S [Pasteurella sp. WM03]